LMPDGTISATGQGCLGIEEWTDIIDIATSDYHAVGLKSDGTVVAIGDNRKGQCNVQQWTDIVSVLAENDYTVGVKSTGEIVKAGGLADSILIPHKRMKEGLALIGALRQIANEKENAIGMDSVSTKVSEINNSYTERHMEKLDDLLALLSEVLSEKSATSFSFTENNGYDESYTKMRK
ncbi:MAG: RCC1 domain-containing protein, partial [Acutalibacteraceae bacterium]|nr:RCC1 domain-containing protein [Acutalibacteraceae bacterium]